MDHSERGEEQVVFRGESDGLSSPTPLQDGSTRDDAEAKHDFCPLREVSFNVITWNPRVKLYVPKEESFPIPLNHIDVARTTHTSLDSLLEQQMDDY